MTVLIDRFVADGEIGDGANTEMAHPHRYSTYEELKREPIYWASLANARATRHQWPASLVTLDHLERNIAIYSQLEIALS